MTLTLSPRIFLLLATGLLFLSAVATTAPAEPVVTIELDTVYIYPGLTDVEMPVYVHPVRDTIVGLGLLFEMSTPEVCSLQASVATEGCIIDPWPLVDVEPGATTAFSLKLRAIGVDLSGPSYPLTPENSNQPVCRLKLDAFDTIHPWANDTVEIRLNTQFVGNFEVVDKYAANIVATGSEIDTSKFAVVEGAVLLRRGICGDVNNDGTGPDISDLTRLVGFLFTGGTPLPVWWQANVDYSADGTIDIGDVTRLVNNLFVDQTPLRCR